MHAIPLIFLSIYYKMICLLLSQNIVLFAYLQLHVWPAASHDYNDHCWMIPIKSSTHQQKFSDVIYRPYLSALTKLRHYCIELIHSV